MKKVKTKTHNSFKPMFLLSLVTNKDSYNTQIIPCVNDIIFRKRFRVPGSGTGSFEPVPTSNHYTGAVLGRQNTSPYNLPPNMAVGDFLQ